MDSTVSLILLTLSLYVSIVTCPPGTFSAKYDTVCVLCAAGSYNEKYGQAACENCPNAQSSDEKGAQTERKCHSKSICFFSTVFPVCENIAPDEAWRCFCFSQFVMCALKAILTRMLVQITNTSHPLLTSSQTAIKQVT